MAKQISTHSSDLILKVGNGEVALMRCQFLERDQSGYTIFLNTFQMNVRDPGLSGSESCWPGRRGEGWL